MFLAEKAVKNYASSVRAKLGLERRTQAAVLASKLLAPLNGPDTEDQQHLRGTRSPMAAAVISAAVDSGPTDSGLEDPTTAQATRAPTDDRSPTTAGSTATSAYARTFGG